MLRHCSLTGNAYGVCGVNSSVPVLDPANAEDNTANNKIYTNSTRNAYFSSTGNIDAEYVWWGTANEADIQGTLQYTGPGAIDYTPWRQASFKPVIQLGMMQGEETPRTLNARGIALAQAGHVTGARALFGQVVRAFPETQEARLAVKYAANTFGDRGAFAEALQYLEELAARMPAGELQARIQYVQLRYLALLQRYDQLGRKVDELIGALPLSYDAPFALLAKGTMQLYGQQDAEAARSTFQRVVEWYPASEAAPMARSYLAPKGQSVAAPMLTGPEWVTVGNMPNPFNPTTTIRFTLPQATPVELIIYNAVGQPVRRLVQADMSAGPHTVIWNGRDETGHEVAAGLYLYRVTAGDFITTRKMVLVR